MNIVKSENIKGASPTIGSALLVVILVTAAAAFGVIYFSTDRTPNAQPTADVSVSQEGPNQNGYTVIVTVTRLYNSEYVKATAENGTAYNGKDITQDGKREEIGTVGESIRIQGLSAGSEVTIIAGDGSGNQAVIRTFTVTS